MAIKHELRYGDQIKNGDVEYLRELAKGLKEDWIICYHVLSSMREGPRAKRLNIEEMDEVFRLHSKGRTDTGIANIFHIDPLYVRRIINAKL